MKKMASLISLFFVTVVVLLSGCVNKRIVYDPNNLTENEPNGVKASIVWVKNSERHLDILVRFQNDYKDTVILKESSMTLDFAGQKVGLGLAGGSIVLMSGVTQEYVAIFKFYGLKEKIFGKATFKINKIYREKDDKSLKPLKINFTVNDDRLK